MLQRMWRKRNLPTLLVGLSVGIAAMENIMELPKKNRIKSPVIQQTHSWAYNQTKLTQKDTYIPVVTEALFIIAKT